MDIFYHNSDEGQTDSIAFRQFNLFTKELKQLKKYLAEKSCFIYD